MNGAAEYIPGAPGSDLLLIADHASNFVPEDIDLGISDDLLGQHMAVDIGVDPLAREIAGRLGCPAILGGVSRLVVDLHRERGEPAAIPVVSDGHAIPGNHGLGAQAQEDRLRRFWDPYHALIASKVDALKPAKLVAIHSFTPRLATRPEEERPWEVGILYAQDRRAAHIAIRLLREAGVVTGDNQPYSGLDLNLTMDLHAESRGIPYIVVEVRQDLIGDDDGVQRWADRLAPVIRATRAALA